MPRLAVRSFDISPVAVRTIALLSLTLVAVGVIAVRLEIATIPAARASDDRNWVRTARGWETLDSLHLPAPHRVALHPGTVAAGQLCGSLLALVTCSRSNQ